MSVAKVIASINEGLREPGLTRAWPDAAANDQADAADAGAAPATAMRPVVIASLVGAACGALAAVAVGLVSAGLYPPLDGRVGPLAERIAGLDSEISKTATILGQLQTELAGLYDEAGAITERVAAGEGEAASRIAQLQDALAQQLDVVAVGSPIFAVAVGQLRSIALTGAPFEAELITVYTLGGADPRTAAAIEKLVAPSRIGIPSIGELRASLVTTAAAAGVSFAADQTYYDYGKSLLSSYTGLTIEPYSIEASRDLVHRADLRLGAHDVAGARTLLHELNSTVGAAMAPWFAVADERLAAETALGTLSGVVIDTLSHKVAGKTSSNPIVKAASGG
jgi:hypothetical protein